MVNEYMDKDFLKFWLSLNTWISDLKLISLGWFIEHWKIQSNLISIVIFFVKLFIYFENKTLLKNVLHFKYSNVQIIIISLLTLKLIYSNKNQKKNGNFYLNNKQTFEKI